MKHMYGFVVLAVGGLLWACKKSDPPPVSHGENFTHLIRTVDNDGASRTETVYSYENDRLVRETATRTFTDGRVWNSLTTWFRNAQGVVDSQQVAFTNDTTTAGRRFSRFHYTGTQLSSSVWFPRRDNPSTGADSSVFQWSGTQLTHRTDYASVSLQPLQFGTTPAREIFYEYDSTGNIGQILLRQASPFADTVTIALRYDGKQNPYPFNGIQFTNDTIPLGWLTYHSDNNLASITMNPANGSVPKYRYTYLYHSSGKPVQMAVYTNGNLGVSFTREFFYD